MTTTNTLIEKRPVYEAYEAVKSAKGAAGVDRQTIEQFEANLKSNLYKIWNRMSSGTYFPPPVHAVSIPKKSRGERILGVPTASDRIAQMVVKQLIEPDLDAVFLPDSYGYTCRALGCLHWSAGRVALPCGARAGRNEAERDRANQRPTSPPERGRVRAPRCRASYRGAPADGREANSAYLTTSRIAPQNRARASSQTSC
jgi:hypothetical protein